MVASGDKNGHSFSVASGFGRHCLGQCIYTEYGFSSMMFNYISLKLVVAQK